LPLEVGYGSGIFLPDLSRRCHALHAVDVHRRSQSVADLLQRGGVHAELSVAPVESLPYDDASFDAVVAVSTLAFVDDIDQACEELKRVLRPDGAGVFVTSGHAKFLDVGLRALTGARAEDTFKGRRQLVLPALRRHFEVEREVRFPGVRTGWLYTAVLASR
jgi:ubiquinone/menaquinone biosynthesis C-methylase UbiE